MTGEDDSASATAGKGSADLQRFLDELEGLNRLPAELRSKLHEPPPDLPFYLAPLNRLDLLDPDEEAMAIWIIDRLHSGDLIAYGRPYGTGQHQKSAVPTADWPQLALDWASGCAQRKLVTSRWGGMVWSELEVPLHCLRDSPPPAAEL